MRRFSLISWAALAAAAIHPTTDLTGIQNLLKRRLPQHASNFEFAIVNATNATAELERVNDDYEVYSTINGKILVQGNSVSGLLYGLNAYLSSEAHVSTWWFIGSQLDQAPQKLPTLSRPLTGSSVVPYRYYLNTVTTSYTMAFWDWDDWSQHLDWMALRGVNIALAWTGFEYLYRDVFKDMGFSDADLEDFLSGPAFQAWNRFGNIQGSWGGSFPTSWADDQHALQLKIVGRMTELGMTPILPAFPGFTPRAITELYPTANVSNGKY
ncbi:tim-barrel domain-containing protein [Xylariaceae sp. FL0255]|nr:tim-barrel domain-containing protein [Xylariaceae sp. FL0255]